MQFHLLLPLLPFDLDAVPAHLPPGYAKSQHAIPKVSIGRDSQERPKPWLCWIGGVIEEAVLFTRESRNQSGPSPQRIAVDVGVDVGVGVDLGVSGVVQCCTVYQ